MVHGVIFTIFLILLYFTMEKRKWPIKRASPRLCLLTDSLCSILLRAKSKKRAKRLPQSD
jgi:hypothetical protein